MVSRDPNWSQVLHTVARRNILCSEPILVLMWQRRVSNFWKLDKPVLFATSPDFQARVAESLCPNSRRVFLEDNRGNHEIKHRGGHSCSLLSRIHETGAREEASTAFREVWWVRVAAT